ncbi:MAG: hypothetical protein ACTSPK_10135 [Candidatus Heimdallarchaeota archaeon]
MQIVFLTVLRCSKPYLISWEDLPRNDVESWDDFKRKVHLYLKDFIVKLKDNTNIIEGSMI